LAHGPFITYYDRIAKAERLAFLLRAPRSYPGAAAHITSISGDPVVVGCRLDFPMGARAHTAAAAFEFLLETMPLEIWAGDADFVAYGWPQVRSVGCAA
jgi:hypothetical protein